MEMKLAENIRLFRKQRGLTQEQFAEIFGVTTGAVYKWESGLSVPELNLLIEMADFFDISVDALLGYRMKDNCLSCTIQRLNEYCRSRNPEALLEAEKALKKYPNSFELVHNCARVYLVFGTGSNEKDKVHRALELLEQACLLISQNTDPEVSELTLYGNMAAAYSLLGEHEKCVELLKKHNEGGIFDNEIGVCLALFLDRPAEAERYLSDALLRSAAALLNVTLGYVFVFLSREDLGSAQEILLWGIDFLRGLRKGNAHDGFDRIYALLLVLLAHLQIRTGKGEEAVATLRKAAELAHRFDAAPDYGLETLRFVSFPENASVHDSLGATAAEGVERILGLLKDQKLDDLWREIDGHA